MHPGKCVFGAESFDFLGHHISTKSLKPQQDKLAAITYLLFPTDKSSLRAAIGLFSSYRKFLNDLCTIAVPLNKVVKKDCPWEWERSIRQFFWNLKRQGSRVESAGPL